MTQALELPHLSSGKVRDVYDAGDDRLLIVASDRISAFDVVMDRPIPDKGRVLTAMSAFWFEHLSDVAPNHLVSTDPAELPDGAPPGRSMLVHRAEMVPLECVVRGYLTGSAFKEYLGSGRVHGVPVPSGMREAEAFPEPMFTPSTKATEGHDVNISFDEAVDLVGAEVAEAARDISLTAFERGAERAAERGIIVADTKFELGFIDGQLAICDEVLTPDSSRFWPAESWEPGTTPPSFDKQPLRDHLDGLDWDKKPPPPTLPDEVVAATADRYRRAHELLCDRPLSDWPG